MTAPSAQPPQPGPTTHAAGDEGRVKKPETRYVLITECLQNDFFLNPECRLYLSETEVKKLLVSKESHEGEAFETKDGHRRVKERLLREGPLVGLPRGDDRPAADRETGRRPARDQRQGLARAQRVLRRGTADARAPLRSRYLGRGLHRRPPAVPESRPRIRTGARASSPAKACASTTSMPTRSSTSGRAGARIHDEHQPKFKQSRLEQLLDILVAGTDEQVARLAKTLGVPSGTEEQERQRSQEIATIADHAIHPHLARDKTPIAHRLRRRDRHLHRRQGADPAREHPGAIPHPEPRRLGQPDREPRARAPSLRARLRGQATESGGDPRDRGPRRLRRLGARARRRVEARRGSGLRQSSAPISRTSRTCWRTRASGWRSTSS